MPEFFFTIPNAVGHNLAMKKIFLSLISILYTACIFASYGIAADQKKKPPPSVKSTPLADEDEKIPLSFKSVIGNWSLKYSGNYGYYFSLSASYRAMVVIYLNTQSFVFKGVYTIDEGNKLKINISEMKDEPKVAGINFYKGFVKVKSSYFLFSGHKTRKNNRETLYLEPRSVIIDGNNSDGYFEPIMKLART